MISHMLWYYLQLWSILYIFVYVTVKYCAQVRLSKLLNADLHFRMLKAIVISSSQTLGSESGLHKITALIKLG